MNLFHRGVLPGDVSHLLCSSEPRKVLKNCVPFELAAFCQDVPFWCFCYFLLFFHIWSRSVINIILPLLTLVFFDTPPSPKPTFWYILCHLPTFLSHILPRHSCACFYVPSPALFASRLCVLHSVWLTVSFFTQTLMAAKHHEQLLRLHGSASGLISLANYSERNCSMSNWIWLADPRATKKVSVFMHTFSFVLLSSHSLIKPLWTPFTRSSAFEFRLSKACPHSVY